MASRPSLLGAVLLAGCDDRLVVKPMAGRDGDMIRAGTLVVYPGQACVFPPAELLQQAVPDAD